MKLIMALCLGHTDVFRDTPPSGWQSAMINAARARARVSGVAHCAETWMSPCPKLSTFSRIRQRGTRRLPHAASHESRGTALGARPGWRLHRQTGPVGGEQLQRWLDDELIVRESNRFYRLVGAPGDTRSRILRAQARLGEPLVACHTTAAELHGFGVLPDPNVHVTTATGRSIRGPEGVVVHQLVPRAPIARVDGLDLIDAADAAVDVAAGGRPIDVLAVLDAARRAGVSEDRLRRAVDGASRQRGILVVRDLATQASPLPESPMESRTRYRILEAGLPPPELQVKVRVSSGGTRRLDHGWRRARVGLEFDGQDFHAGDGSLDRDRHKQADLLAAGWTVIYVTASDVYRMPERFTDPLRVLLGRRGCLTTATVQPAAS